MRISRQRIKMCATVKPHNIRDMTKEMEQAEMRLKVFMLRDVTLPISSTSSVAGKSASGPSAPKKRRGVNTVDQAFNKEATDELDCIIARMFYMGGLSFNLTRNSWYIKAFKFVANNAIVGYKPSGYNSLRILFCKMRNLM